MPPRARGTDTVAITDRAFTRQAPYDLKIPRKPNSNATPFRMRQDCRQKYFCRIRSTRNRHSRATLRGPYPMGHSQKMYATLRRRTAARWASRSIRFGMFVFGEASFARPTSPEMFGFAEPSNSPQDPQRFVEYFQRGRYLYGLRSQLGPSAPRQGRQRRPRRTEQTRRVHGQ